MSNTSERISVLARMGDSELLEQCALCIQEARRYRGDRYRQDEADNCRFACLQSDRLRLWHAARDRADAAAKALAAENWRATGGTAQEARPAAGEPGGTAT